MPVHWRAYLGIAVLGTALAGLSSPVTAQAEPGRSVLPESDECTTPAPPDAKWTEQEIWAWKEICLGRRADMSDFSTEDRAGCDPAKADSWPPTRQIRPRFLETVLLHEPYRGALTRTGVRIKCARFTSLVDLGDAVIRGPLWLERSRLDQGMNLIGAKLSNILNLEGSFVAGTFWADRMDVAGPLFMRRAHFNEVRLVGARVGGDLSAIGSSFDGAFTADGLEITGSLRMSSGASFKTVQLIDAKVGRTLDLSGSAYEGHVDLTGLEVAGELRLATPHEHHPPPQWKDGARITLRNVSVDALQDVEEAWDGLEQGEVVLSGFEYERLGGLADTPGDSMADRSVDWLLGWLDKQPNADVVHNPQPYEQLAAVLRAGGQAEKANDILFASRSRFRDADSTPLLTKLGLWFQYYLIGYGYRNLHAIGWFALLLGVGTVLSRGSTFRLNRPMSVVQRFCYCVDKAIPFIGLDKRHDYVMHPGLRVSIYFYVHRLIGFALATFLIAGLSGLTK